MKIALITEGDAEFAALPKILPQIRTATKNSVMNPLKVACHPEATAAVIARKCEGTIKVARAKGANRVVLFLDRETRLHSPGAIAEEIECAIERLHLDIPVKVVMKDRMFENWLVADFDALEAQPGRFHVNDSARRLVEPEKADNVNALQLLKKWTRGDYDKVADAIKICGRMTVIRAAWHSKSFRHFLHELDCLDGNCCRDAQLLPQA